MNIVTLAECKERLSIDFDTKDNEITIMANSIESYLFFATGLKIEYEIVLDGMDNTLNLAKEYVLFKLYLDYYNAQTELDDRRLQSMLNQLKVVALYEHS